MSGVPTTRAVLDSYLAALTAGDLAAIADSFAPDATWRLHGTLPLSGTRLGRDAIMDFLVGAGALYEPGTQRFTFGDLTCEDDRCVLEWSVHGIATATRNVYDNRYCAVFVIRAGRIAEVREYLDTQHAAEVLFGPETRRS